MNHQITAPEPTERVSHARMRLNYKPGPSFPYRIAGTPADREQAIIRIEAHYAEAIEALRTTESRNREPATDYPLQDYYCIGCLITEGTLRAKVLSLAAYPLLQAAMVRILGEKLTLQCYFAQTYEEKSGIGPGGIIGTVKADSNVEPDTSARRGYAYSGWVSSSIPIAYKPEEEAKLELWRDSYRFLSQAKHWLMHQSDVPAEGIPFPQELSHELHGLLGVAAMRALVADKLGRNWVLLDAHRVTLAENLHWSLAA
ncbi:MAG: hypothetical protein DI628_01175 [Blastochloris viridis]|uniref:Uncharacterized protein n=1 Tax=Blastochloris viridis TaxID=1079 RepID=A0A6N4R334_BLAVI|nr:MAG: hypothetical protein DI628_01175 [Blastochloris viridis]